MPVKCLMVKIVKLLKGSNSKWWN